MLHCWNDELDFVIKEFGVDSKEHANAKAIPSTCFLERDHDGPCEFIPDDDILVKFSKQ